MGTGRNECDLFFPAAWCMRQTLRVAVSRICQLKTEQGAKCWKHEWISNKIELHFRVNSYVNVPIWGGLLPLSPACFKWWFHPSVFLWMFNGGVAWTSQSPCRIPGFPATKWLHFFKKKKKDFAANLSKGFAWYIFQSEVKRSHPQTHLAIAPHPQRLTTSPRNFYGFQLSVQSPSSYSIEDEVCHLLCFSSKMRVEKFWCWKTS